jgi:hypothetical protein
MLLGGGLGTSDSTSGEGRKGRIRTEYPYAGEGKQTHCVLCGTRFRPINLYLSPVRIKTYFHCPLCADLLPSAAVELEVGVAKGDSDGFEVRKCDTCEKLVRHPLRRAQCFKCRYRKEGDTCSNCKLPIANPMNDLCLHCKHKGGF